MTSTGRRKYSKAGKWHLIRSSQSLSIESVDKERKFTEQEDTNSQVAVPEIFSQIPGNEVDNLFSLCDNFLLSKGGSSIVISWDNLIKKKKTAPNDVKLTSKRIEINLQKFHSLCWSVYKSSFFFFGFPQISLRTVGAFHSFVRN